MDPHFLACKEVFRGSLAPPIRDFVCCIEVSVPDAESLRAAPARISVGGGRSNGRRSARRWPLMMERSSVFGLPRGVRDRTCHDGRRARLDGTRQELRGSPHGRFHRASTLEADDRLPDAWACAESINKCLNDSIDRSLTHDAQSQPRP